MPDADPRMPTRSWCRCCPRISTSTPASRCIASLLLVAKVKRTDNRLAIIANRVRRNTRMAYQSLTRFLGTLDIPIIATLRDSQNYVRGAELGLGLHEMRHYQVSRRPGTNGSRLLAWLDEPSRMPRAQTVAAPGPLALKVAS